MAVTFPDDIHPRNKLILKFKYSYRALQYLEYFKIIENYPTNKFLPFDMTFENSNDLNEFLIKYGIIYYCHEVSDFYPYIGEMQSIVDTNKIWQADINVSYYIHNFKFFSINEVAELLSFSRPTIYKIIKDGKLKTYRINGQMRIKYSDLTDYINIENQG